MDTVAVTQWRTDMADTQSWYANYYRQKGADRNDLVNPEVVFQTFANEGAVIAALRGIDPASKVLDVGCGTGSSLNLFLRCGFSRLFGVDILADRIAAASAMYRSIAFNCADARRLPYDSQSFDVVTESTMFVQLTDEKLAADIAAEMLRVTKPGGRIILIDWRYGKPGNKNYLAVSRQRIERLFPGAKILSQRNGALIPPVGRFLSKHAPSLYFLARAICPFLAGIKVTVLQI